MLLSHVMMTVMTVYCVVSTHSLTHSLTYSLTHSLTYSLTHLLTYLLTHSLTYLLTHSLTYLLTYSLTHVDAANNQLYNSPHACYSCSSLYLVADVTDLFNEFKFYNRFSKSTIILAQHWLRKYFIDEKNQRYGSSLTHSLIHSLTYSLTHALTYSLT